MVFGFYSASQYKEELLLVRAVAVEKALCSIHRFIIKQFKHTTLIKGIFSAIKTGTHLSETTKSNASIDFNVLCKQLGDKLYIFRTVFDDLKAT